jgi:hypothetical protein
MYLHFQRRHVILVHQAANICLDDHRQEEERDPEADIQIMCQIHLSACSWAVFSTVRTAFHRFPFHECRVHPRAMQDSRSPSQASRPYGRRTKAVFEFVQGRAVPRSLSPHVNSFGRIERTKHAETQSGTSFPVSSNWTTANGILRTDRTMNSSLRCFRRMSALPAPDCSGKHGPERIANDPEEMNRLLYRTGRLPSP